MKRKLAILLTGCMLSMSIFAQAAEYTDAETVKAVQERLNEEGFDCGTADGIMGSKTRDAISAYLSANGLEGSGEIDDDLLKALEIGEEEETEDDGITGTTTADGTVLYSDHDVTVTAKAGSGTEVIYQVQNDSDAPVLVKAEEVIANDVTFVYIYSRDYVSAPYELNYLYYFESGEEDFEKYGGLCYVNAGETDTFTYEADKLSDMFGYESISSLQTAVGVYGLSKEAAFDGTDAFTDSDVTFSEYSKTVDVQIDGAEWTGEWENVDGTVLYESDQIKVTATGDPVYSYGSTVVDLLLENKTDSTISLNQKYGETSTVNGEAMDSYIYMTALSGTRTIGTMDLYGDDYEESKEITSVFSSLYLENDSTYETIAEFDYAYGEDAEALKDASKLAGEEKAAADKAAAIARLDYSIEEQTLLDVDGYTVTATGIGSYYEGGEARLYLTVSNANETDAYLLVEKMAINGFVTSNTDFVDLNAGETKDEEIYLYDTQLKQIGIEDVGEITLTLSLKDDYYNDLTDTVTVSIQTSAYETMDTEPSEEIRQIYSADGVEVSAGLIPPADEYSYPAIAVVMRNAGSTDVHATLDNVYINDALYEMTDWGTISMDLTAAAGETYTSIWYISMDELDGEIEDLTADLTFEDGREGAQDLVIYPAADEDTEAVSEAVTEG